MINRLPKEFQAPPVNGVKSAPPTEGKASRLSKRVMGQATRCIGDYPIAALSAAFLAGLVIGRMVKR